MKITKKLPLKNVASFHPEIKDRTDEVLERKSLVSNFTALEDGEAIGVISTPSVDNDGDIIDPMGIKTDIYNGTCQWNHSLDTLPLGTVTEFTITSEGVKGKFKFSKTYDFAVDVYNLVKENILKGISIGYIPLKALKRGTSAFNEYAKARGWDVTDCQRIITECLWIETSMVPVGCNNDALILASKSFKSEMSFKNFKLETKGCDEQDENKVITEDNVETVAEEVVQEIPTEETEAIAQVSDTTETQELPIDAASNVETEAILPNEPEVQVTPEVSEVLPDVIEQQVEEPVVKPLVLKILRKGKMQVTEEIKRKAALFLQGKSF